MNKRLLNINKNFTAGVIIGLCCYLYQNCMSQLIGAFLFGIGLCTICECQLPLFTGRVGKSNDIKNLRIIFLYNVIGIMSTYILLNTNLLPYYLSMGIGCGMLMQIGVVMYNKSPIITIMCVAAFILCGFKHCIAMVFNTLDLNWLLVILGNIIGAKLMYYGGVVDQKEKELL